MKMKLIIVLCAVSMAASWPVYEDPYQNWGIYIPPEPEYYDDYLNSDYNRPIDFNPITHKPRIRKSTTSTTTYRSIPYSPEEPKVVDVVAIMKKFYEDNPSYNINNNY